MNCKSKRIVSLLLALCLALSFCACGKSGEPSGKSGSVSTPEETPSFLYAAEYTQIGKDDDFYPELITDTGLYLSHQEKVADGVVPEGATLEYEGQYDILEPRLSFCDLSGNVSPLEAYRPVEPDTDAEGKRDFRITQGISRLFLDGDGNLSVLESVYCSWSDAPESVKASDPEYYTQLKSESAYYLRTLDSTGAELGCVKLSLDTPDDVNAYSSQFDEKGNLLISTNESGILAFKPDGSPAYKLDFNGWVYSIVKLRNGRLGVLCYDMSTYEISLRLVDSSAGAFEAKSYSLPSGAYELIDGGGDYDLYYTSGTHFYGYSLDEENAVELFDWIGCDVNSSQLQQVSVSEDGLVRGVLRSDSAGDTPTYELVTVSKLPYDSVPHKESLRMATLYLDYNAQNAVIDFNRSHDNYRIDVTDYSEYNTPDDYTAGTTKLLTEIMAGNVPDILCISTDLPYRQLAAKGLLEDLYPYLEADAQFNRDDFFPNVLSAMEMDGKLYVACAGFMVQTAVGASSVVGDTPGWTYDDYAAALATMPEGCEGFPIGVDRDTMLEICLALDMTDYVDWSAGRCHFDSEEFIKVLEFANTFPDASVYENYEYSADDSDASRIAQGKQMLIVLSLFSTDYFLYDLDQLFGGSSTCVGFPTNNGVGNVLGMGESYAMSSSCRNKDAAWEFLHGFLTEDYQLNTSYLPTNRKAFEKQLEKSMEVIYEQDANGNYILDENGERIPQSLGMVSDGVNTYEIYATTPRQAEQLREVIASAEKMMDYDTSIIDIVKEQAAAYFSGQKSAEETAKLIQSKANIYINEQK